MEQISLEDKVNNTLKWLANNIAYAQIRNLNEKKKNEWIYDAWQKVQEQLKKDIDWNTLTESQCRNLHFGVWQSEEDIEKKISHLQSELDNGNLTKESFDKKVTDYKNTLGLYLIPVYLYPSLPIGITLTSIVGKDVIFDGSNIDLYVRYGFLSYGIKPKKD